MMAMKNAARCQRCGWQEGFLTLLPAIRKQVRYAFRRLPCLERSEAIQDAIANALVAYRRLAQLGRESLAFATPLARFAIKQVRTGRKVGGRLNVRDVMSLYCQRRKGVKVQPFVELDPRTGRWQDLLVEDRHSSPADIAALKLEFQAWLCSLTPKKRAITQSLAGGESAGQVAKLFSVSAARVSQIRRELRTLWEQFQGELDLSPVIATG
jgi:DNA-directed RNA polymerase sigma subunit (sigma70/sigma32)